MLIFQSHNDCLLTDNNNNNNNNNKVRPGADEEWSKSNALSHQNLRVF